MVNPKMLLLAEQVAAYNKETAGRDKLYRTMQYFSR